MLKYNPLHCLPSAEELPDSDDPPEERVFVAEQRALAAEQRARQLTEQLRALGIDPHE